MAPSPLISPFFLPLLCQSWWIRSCDCLVRPLERLPLWDCGVFVLCVCFVSGPHSWLDWIAFTGRRAGWMNKAPSVRPSPPSPPSVDRSCLNHVLCLRLSLLLLLCILNWRPHSASHSWSVQITLTLNYLSVKQVSVHLTLSTEDLSCELYYTHSTLLWRHSVVNQPWCSIPNMRFLQHFI